MTEPLEQFSAIGMIAAERARQVEVEGFVAEHDDLANIDGELAYAAACYAVPECSREGMIANGMWPWDRSWLKNGDRMRELAKAGALIVAEMERINRERTVLWKIRLRNELTELEGRMDKLHAFIGDASEPTESFLALPEEDRVLLLRQYEVMGDLHTVLCARVGRLA
jgi:hypothetical protein